MDDAALKEAQRKALVAIKSIVKDMEELLQSFDREWGPGTRDELGTLIARTQRARDNWRKLILAAFTEREHGIFSKIEHTGYGEFPDASHEWVQWIKKMKHHVIALGETVQKKPGMVVRIPKAETMNAKSTPKNPRTVFVVLGKNVAINDAMFQFLTAIDLRPLEWTEARALTGEPSPYVGQILDAAFEEASAVVVLMTPDDEARLRNEFRREGDGPHEVRLTPQARPNVLYEAGMAMGLHPKRTVLVAVGKLRPFSDIDGRHVVHMNNSPERRQDLAERLKTAGCPVKTTGQQWYNAGNFELDSSDDEDSDEDGAGADEAIRNAANELLRAALESERSILVSKHSGGTSVVVGGIKHPPDENARGAALYIAAVEWLFERDLVESNDSGDVFSLTHHGYEAAEQVK